MKIRLIFSLLSCLLFTHIGAQNVPFDAAINVMPPYPTNYAIWMADYESYMITLTNTSDRDFEVFVRVSIEGESNGEYTFLKVADTYTPESSLGVVSAGGTRVITSADIESSYSNIGFDDFETSDNITIPMSVTDVLLSGESQLPEGTYRICVEVWQFSETDELLLSPNICSESFEVNSGTIELFEPAEGAVLEEDLSINITWSSYVSNADFSSDLLYRVNIYDLLGIDTDQESIYELIETGGISPMFTSEDVASNQYTFDWMFNELELEVGGKYAVQVEIIDPGDVSFETRKSNIHTFYYGTAATVFNPDFEVPDDCESRCFVEVPTNTQVGVEIPEALRIGYFVVSGLTLRERDGKFSGTGKIKMDFLNGLVVPVDLKDIVFDVNGVVIEGYAKAQKDEVPELSDYVEHLNLGALEPYAEQGVDMGMDYMPPEIAGIISETLANLRLASNLVSGGEMGVPIAFNRNIQQNSVLFGITSLLFEPTGAKAEMMAGFKLPLLSMDDWLMFKGDEMCIHPKGFGNEFVLELASDVDFGNEDISTYQMFIDKSTFNEETEERHGCFLKMECEGVKEINIQGRVLFSRNHLLPDSLGLVPKTGQVTSTFNINIVNVHEDEGADDSEEQDQDIQGTNLMAEINFTPFQIKGVDGWSFTVNEAYLDISDLANPEDMVFPKNYEHLENETEFKGFYLKSMTISPPNDFDSTTTRPMVAVTDLIIEPNVYFKLQANDILDQGALDSWAITIDSLELEVFNNSLRHAKFKGELGTPITAGDDRLQYRAMINTDVDDPDIGAEYDFNISLNNEIKFPLIIAKGRIDESSYVSISGSFGKKSKHELKLDLVGSLNIRTSYITDAMNIQTPVDINITDIDFTIAYSSTEGLDNDRTSFALASPQKFISGFPISLGDFGMTQVDSLISLRATASIGLKPGQNQLQADISFKVNSELELDTDSRIPGIKRFKPLNVEVDSISIDAEFSSFQVAGSLYFYKNTTDTLIDKGIDGKLQVQFPFPLFLELEAQFGRITPVASDEVVVDTDNNFRYFRIYANLANGLAPIAPLGPVSIYGINGGLVSNMSVTVDQATGDRTYAPDKGSFGFDAGVTLALTPKPDALNADISLGMSFSSSGGLDEVRFKGDFYIMTPMADRASPKFKAVVNLTVSPDPFVFAGEFEFYTDANFEVVQLVGVFEESEPTKVCDGELLISADSFYFHMGKAFGPRGKMAFNFPALDDMGFVAETYLQIGQKVPTELPPIEDWIQDIISGISNEVDVTDGQSVVQTGTSGSDNVANGQGFAHGAYIEANAGMNAYVIKAELRAGIGYDLNFTQSQNRYCAGNVMGVNGWYAQAQAYAGLEGSLFLFFKFMGAEIDFLIGELAMGASLMAKLPNPAYFQGRAGIRFNVLNGKIKGDAQVEIELGKSCDEFDDNPLGLDIVDVSSPEDSEVSSPFRNSAIVKFILPINKDFDLNVSRNKVRKHRIDLNSVVLKKGNRLPRINKSWSDDQTLVIEFEEPLEGNEQYKIAMNFTFTRYKGNDRDIKESERYSRDIEFTTSRIPRSLNPLVIYSSPSKGQHYFCKDDPKYIDLIDGDLSLHTNYFYDSKDGKDFEYKLRLTCIEDEDFEDFDFIVPADNANHISLNDYDLGLEHNKTYVLQIIRRNTFFNHFNDNPNIKSSSINVQGFLTNVNVEQSNLFNLSSQMGLGEQPIFKTYFKTGKYDRFRDKLRAMTASQASNYTTLFNSNIIAFKLTIDERLDKCDLRRFIRFNAESQYNSNYQFYPLLYTAADILTCADVRNAANVVKPVLNIMTSKPTLDLHWNEPYPYASEANIIQGPIEQPFDLNDAIASHNANGNTSSGRYTPPANGLSIPISYIIRDDRYRKMIADKRRLLQACQRPWNKRIPVDLVNNLRQADFTARGNIGNLTNIRTHVRKLNGPILTSKDHYSRIDFNYAPLGSKMFQIPFLPPIEITTNLVTGGFNLWN